MQHRGLGQWIATLLLAVACALPPAVTPEDPPLAETTSEELPVAAGLSAEQQQTLRAGGRVEQFVRLERGGKRYVGGVGYVLVRAEPRQVFEVLNEVSTLSDVLPKTRSTRILDRNGNRVRMELEQGTSVVSTTFTVFFELEPPDGRFDPRVVRFWLDPSQPHSIDDVWGFFRATRYDDQYSLVSVGALVDLGTGVIRMLFEERIQRSILRTPNRIRDTVERIYGSRPAQPITER
ncbi:MAG: SRPBCC family protein [Deltaproteobacteria bacterium]